MGHQDLLQLEPLLNQPLVDSADVVAWINDDGFPGLLVTQDGAVALQRPDGKNLKDHDTAIVEADPTMPRPWTRWLRRDQTQSRRRIRHLAARLGVRFR